MTEAVKTVVAKAAPADVERVLPSENTEDIPQWPGFRAAGFFDDAPTPEPADSVEEFIERATNANDPELGLVFAQLATVRAVQAQTEQMRIGNKLRVNLIEQLGEMARATSNPMYASDPALPITGITPDEWAEVGL